MICSDKKSDLEKKAPCTLGEAKEVKMLQVMFATGERFETLRSVLRRTDDYLFLRSFL